MAPRDDARMIPRQATNCFGANEMWMCHWLGTKEIDNRPPLMMNHELMKSSPPEGKAVPGPQQTPPVDHVRAPWYLALGQDPSNFDVR